MSVTVIECGVISDYKKLYIVVDNEIGEILDDNQGLGYKTSQSAIKAWNFKEQKQKLTEERICI